MTTDQIGRHEVLLTINHDFNKICDILLGSFFLIKTQEILRLFLLAVKKKAIQARTWWCILSNYLGMTRIVVFNCPIKAENRAVDSQSDLRILL